MNLSRCKHCGAIAHYAKSVTDPHLCWSIQRSDCGISTPSYSQQEMAAAAWERTAAAQKYGHRNGETEAPSVEDLIGTGVYWFRGTVTSWDCGTYDVTGLVECTLAHAYNDVCGETLDKNSYTGQWWGPIVAPWEQSQ